MTYVVAWKDRDRVFLVADSAVTNTQRQTLRSEVSTFGEAHVAKVGEVTEEAAFKLFRWANLAIACSGHQAPILDFVRCIETRLAQRFSPWAALAVARRETKISPNQSFEGVAAVQFLGAPRLFRLDEKGEWHFTDETIIHLGSPALHLKQLVHTTVGDARRARKSPEIQLACVLASCQSLTIQQGLLEQGAGGAFSGLIFDRSGTRWQPDMAYLVLDPNGFSEEPSEEPTNAEALYVTCIIRHDTLVVNSQKRGVQAFRSSLNMPPKAPLEQQVKDAAKEAQAVRLACTFDFVGIISTRYPLTAVLETKRQADSAHLRLRYLESDGKPRALVVNLGQQVASTLRGSRGEPNVPRIFFYSEEQKTAAAA